MAESRVLFDIVGKDQASPAFKSAGDSAEGLHRTLGNLAKVAAGAFAAAGVIEFGKKSVEAFNESEDANLKLQQAYSKMPALRGSNAKAISAEADALQRKTKFDDESAKTAAANLAQFGLTDKQLRELLPLVEDYAARTGMDLPDAAKKVGLAFLGNTRALKQVGIEFKATGDRGKDFTKITDLLRSRVGGFATKEGQTFSGRMAILHNQINEMQERIGGALVPALSKLATFAADVVPKAMAFLGRVIKDIVATWNDPGITSSGFFGVIEKGTVIVHRLWDTVRSVVNALREGFTNRGPLEGAVGWWRTLEKFGAVAHTVTDFIRDHFKPILIGLGVAFGLAFAPVTTIVVGLAVLYAKSQLFRDIVASVANFISTKFIPAIQAMVDWIQTKLIPVIASVVEWINVNLVPTFRDAFDAIAAIVKVVLAVVVGVIVVYVGIIKDLWDRFGQHLIDHLQTAFNAIRQVVQGVLEVIRGIFDIFAGIFTGDWGRVWEGIKEIFGGIFNALSGIVKFALNEVSTAIGAGMAVISAVWDAIWGGFTGAMSTAFGVIKQIAINIVNFISQDLVNPVIRIIDSLIRAYNDLPGWLRPTGKIPVIGEIPKINTPADPLKTGSARPASDRTAEAGPSTPGPGHVPGSSRELDTASLIHQHFYGTPDKDQVASATVRGMRVAAILNG